MYFIGDGFTDEIMTTRFNSGVVAEGQNLGSSWSLKPEINCQFGKVSRSVKYISLHIVDKEHLNYSSR